MPYKIAWVGTVHLLFSMAICIVILSHRSSVVGSPSTESTTAPVAPAASYVTSTGPAITPRAGHTSGDDSGSEIQEERERLKKELVSLGVPEDFASCVENVSEAMANARRTASATPSNETNDTVPSAGATAERELWNSAKVSLLDLWDFLLEATAADRRPSGTNLNSSENLLNRTGQCWRAEQQVCHIFFPCLRLDGACGCTTPSVRTSIKFGVCREIRAVHSMLLPLTLSKKGQLKLWLQLAEQSLCPEHAYTQCSVMSNMLTYSHQCPYPLQPTQTLSHQSADFRSEVRTAETKYFVPAEKNISYAGNFEFFPCGDHCRIMDPWDSRTKFLDAWARISALCQFILPLVAYAAAFRAGMREMLRYPNRLQIHLATATLIFGLFLLPHMLIPITGRRIACNTDHTQKAESGLKSDVGCVFTYSTSTGGGMMFQLITLFVAVAWWQLILKLGMNRRWYVVQMDGKVELLWFVAALTWSIVVVVVQYKDSAPLVTFFILDFCISLYQGSEYIHFTPSIMFLGFSVLILIDGVRRMQRLHQGSIRLRRRSSPHNIHRKRTSDRTLLRMARRLRGYICGLVSFGKHRNGI